MTDFAIATDQMFATAARLATHHANSDEHFRERHSQLSGAVEAGWVGRSANVMSGALGRWQSDANVIVARIAGHSAGVVRSTNQFVDVDDTAAGSLAPGTPSTLDL
ncbi:WXG100 family type VII secretion target [Williamsia limnetica]|uniref:WXG100 family type VII secretion target n=1 Tax=Williamsia limnetica TaxID=882452 RepID=UPI000D7CB434